MKREDQNTEYKQSWRDEYLKWICGFANADGGRMFIGIKDDKDGNTIVGVTGWKPLLEAIPNLMRDTMGMIADVNHIRKEGKDLVEIIVPAYPVPISLRGVYYIRRGATNQRLSGPGLEAFLLKRRGLHWENLPCPRLRWKDISTHEIKRFKDLAIEKGRLDAAVRREKKDEFITNLHLVGKDGLSFASALLFTEKAEKWIPGAYIKVGKFGEDEADLVFHDDVHGSLLQQAEETLSLIYFKYLKAKIWYENGEQRVEKFPFPREALRELILNALVHKDYASNIPIQISVSDDKIYVANIGALPETWTLEKLLGKHSSRPFNPTIAGCVYLTGKIETWGRGVRKVFDECKRHGCPPPVYEVSAGDPGDIQVRIDAAPDAIVKEVTSSKIVDPLNDPINDPIKSKSKGPSRGPESGEVAGEVAWAESASSRHPVGTQSAPSRHPVGTQSRSPVDQDRESSICERVIMLCRIPQSTKDLLSKIGRSDRSKFKRFVMRVLMEDGIVEYTIPDKPNSRLQKYRLTAKGRALVAKKAIPTV